MKNFMTKTAHIYSHLQDAQSKQLFNARLLYALTGDYAHIRRIIEELPQKRKLDSAMDVCRRNIGQMVVYGVGNDLLLLERLYPEVEFQFFCDRNEQKQREGWRGKTVMSPDRLLEEKENFYVAVNSSGYHREIMEFLLKNGVERERIINLGEISAELMKLQYFDENIVTPDKNEVFVDGGCYNCGTAENFVEWCHGEYRKIYAFEPDRANYEKCLAIAEQRGLERLQVLNRGLWDCEAQLAFDGQSGQGSRIAAGNNGETILTAAIDDVVGTERVSFIKLDVEGAELRALKGAEKTIRSCRPRLAICIYHKPEDVIEIPEYILSLHEDYRLYIRHYQLSDCETVLYAV